MSGTNSSQGGLTRRSFLKTTGAVAGAAVFGGSALGCVSGQENGSMPTEVDEQVFCSVCGINCAIERCGMKVHVRDGRIMKVSAKDSLPVPSEFPEGKYMRRPCLRGRSHVQWMYHPERIKYPMRRVEGTERGAGEWERITWDEAIEEIAEKFNGYRKEFGNQSIAMIQPTGNARYVQGGQGVYARFANVAQATYFDYCLDWGWGHGVGRVVGQIYGSFNNYYDFSNSKVILMWGGNFTESAIQFWHWIQDAHEGGTKLVCIDPRFSIAASKSDVWVPLKAGSDSALAQAMLNVVIDRELYNEKYLLEHSVAPFLVREDTGKFLRMSDLGVEPAEGPANALTGEPTIIDPVVVWDDQAQSGAPEGECSTPALEGSYVVQGFKVTTAFDMLKREVAESTSEWAAGLTGLDPLLIEEVAEMAADGPCGIHVGFGFDRVDNGDIVAHALATLQTLTGNMSVPGGGINWPPNFSGGMVNFGMQWASPDPEKMYSNVPWQCLPDILETGKFKGEPYPIKAFLNLNHNMFANQTQQKEFLEEILPQIEFVVTHDSRMTDTCRYSDIVLPAAHYFEQDDVSASDWLEICEKAVDPLYESRDNLDFLSALAEKMGLGEYFTQTATDVIEEIINESAEARAEGITFGRLREEKTIWNISKSWDHGVIWHDMKFPSPSGRLEFYQENPMPRMDYGQTIDEEYYRLPRYSTPIEAWDGADSKKQYPLILFQEHARWRAHTAFAHLPWLRELDPEPIVKLNPADAKARGLSRDDTVKVFNDRGSVTLKVRIDTALPEGMCNIPKGWDRHQCIDGCYQELTPRTINPMSLNMLSNDTRVEIQKVQ